jgi:hypothetical protein
MLRTLRLSITAAAVASLTACASFNETQSLTFPPGPPAPGSDINAFVVIGQGTARTETVLGMCRLFYSEWNGSSGMKPHVSRAACRPGEIEYNVLNLRPGTYTLVETFAYQTGATQTSNYRRKPERITFELKANEVVYIGDLIYTRFFPSDLKEVLRNDAAARQALAALKINTDGMFYRPIDVAPVP